MKKFLEKYFNYIVFGFLIIVMLKGCNEVRVLNEVNDTLIELEDSTFTKQEFSKIYALTQIYNKKNSEKQRLEGELRFYQSTDRRILDVNRQSELVEKIKILDEEINEIEKRIYEEMVK